MAEHFTDAELAVADQLGDQMVRLVRLSHHAKTRFAAGTRASVERANYALLARLICDGPQRATALAEAVHADPSTVSRQVSSLVQLGLVERQADQVDGRASVLVATDAGRAAFDEYRASRNRHVATLLSSWPEADRHQVVRLLDRLNTDLQRYVGTA